MKKFLLSLIALAWIASAPAYATIAIDATGHGEVPSGGPPLAQTSPMSIAAGDTVIEVCETYLGTSNPFQTNQFSVGAINTLTPVITTPLSNPSIGTGTSTNVGVWACQNCAAETNNRFNCQTTGGSGNYISFFVVALKNVPASATIDVAEYTVSGSTTTPNYTTTHTTVQANEMAIGALSSGGQTTYSSAPGWTPGTSSYNQAGTVGLAFDTLVLNHTQQVNYNPTVGAAGINTIVVITVKDVNAGGGGITAHNGMLLNVGP